MSIEVRKLAVVGHPISHSLSPRLHQAAYTALGVPWSYEAVDVPSGEFSKFLKSTDSLLLGVSVTMPHKIDAFQAADSRDLLSERTGSVNTLLCEYDGSGARLLKAFNTDVFGIVNALADSGVEHARHVAVIGGGATASSAVAAAAEMGAEHVSVVVRTPQKAFYLESVGQECGVTVSVHPFDDMRVLSAAEVVISTLPGDAVQSLSELSRVEHATLLDVSYSPWPSVRGTEWAVSGGDVVSGLRMLAHQALIQVRIFVGGSPFAVLENELEVKKAMFISVGLDSIESAI